MLKNKSILITGGTGSFGKKFVQTILRDHPEVKKVIVYSRDELKQFEMNEVFSDVKYPQLRYFIGDVRDGDRLRRACEGVDIIVHAAALKQVPTAEYNPMECIRTNVFGAENVINAAFDCNVKKVVALSTDKAASPVNLYGATKLCSDKLFISANNMKGTRDLACSVVRYGNVLGSRGSVVPFFLERRKSGVIPITDPKMTRFNITLEEGVDLVLHAIENAMGGELYVPKIPSYRILELKEAVAPGCRIEHVGVRPGEKVNEEMITETDSLSTFDCGKYYVIAPTTPLPKLAAFLKTGTAKPVAPGFSYSSHTNSEWLTVDQIRAQIRQHVDPSFQPA